MKSEHTRGPWKWVGNDLEGPQYTDVVSARVACGQWCQGGSVELTMKDADKALIEAAPDLLDALKDLCMRYEVLFHLYAKHAYIRDGSSDLRLALTTAHLALAKAEPAASGAAPR